jgi:cell division septal protein FtsQ
MNERDARRRSEIIRRKLNQESQTSIRQAARRVVEPPVVPTREKTGQAQNAFMPLSEALNPENSSAVKRRFRPGWRIISLLLVGLFSYAIFTAWTAPQYKISAIQISGLQRLNEAEVLAKVDVINQHIFAVQPDEIIKAVAAGFPELRDIQVNLSLPAQVKISVIERQPMIAWQAGDTLLWIDTEGYLIPARGQAASMLTIQANSLPVYQLDKDLREDNTAKMIQDKSIEKTDVSEMAFFSQTKHVDSTLLAGILQLNAWMPNETTLLYQRQRGLGWKDSRGWEVYLGQKLENINDKMVMYDTIVKGLEKQGVNPTLVSVEFLYAPYYRVD